MKILAITFTFNEQDYLPYAVDYYRKQGVDLYVIDNFSTDGTFKWVKEQGISGHQVDTQDAFHLQWLQDALLTVVKEVKPDWFIWFSPDLFHVLSLIHTLREVIEMADAQGFNQIKSPCYCFRNTGEDFQTPLPKYYRYAFQTASPVLLISKYVEGNTTMLADVIIIPEPKIFEIGRIFEYGGCKPALIQEIKLARRQRAWELGVPCSHGSHYLRGKELGWIYSKNELTDMWDDTNQQYLLNIQ